MQILIARNGKPYGPYTLDQIQNYLASGEVQSSDLAWHEGLPSWVPLAQMSGVRLPQVSTLLPPPPPVTPIKPPEEVKKRPLSGDAAIICPHCNHQGLVRTKKVKQKRGISGGKATAALLTGGVSILAIGLSRKERFTEAYCGKCKSTWLF